MNTYQGILVGNGTITYSIFTYTCGEIEWSSIGTEAAVVGYNIHGDFFRNEIGSGLSSVGEVIACSVVIDGSRRRRRQLDPTVTSYLNMIPGSGNATEKQETCARDLSNDAMLFTVEELDAQLILPNCSLTTPRSIDQFETDPLNSNCYLSLTNGTVKDSRSGFVYTFVQQCCYDTNG